MARSRDFNQIADDLIRAQARGDNAAYKDAMYELTARLDDMVSDIQGVKQGAQTKMSGGPGSGVSQIAAGGTSAARVAVMPRAIANGTALRKPLAMKITENAKTTASMDQIAGVDDPMTGYTLQSGRDVDGEVFFNAAINWQNGAIRLATATDASLHCSGIVFRNGNFIDQFEFRDGGLCYALIKLPIQTDSNRLYLSVTPGFLTTNPAEVGKVINQEVGRFRKFLNPNAWQAQDGAAVAEISFQYSPYS